MALERLENMLERRVMETTDMARLRGFLYSSSFSASCVQTLIKTAVNFIVFLKPKSNIFAYVSKYIHMNTLNLCHVSK